jgi:hypothetical protein
MARAEHPQAAGMKATGIAPSLAFLLTLSNRHQMQFETPVTSFPSTNAHSRIVTKRAFFTRAQIRSQALPRVRELVRRGGRTTASPQRRPHSAAASFVHPPIARTASQAFPGVRRLAAAQPQTQPCHQAASIASITSISNRRDVIRNRLNPRSCTTWIFLTVTRLTFKWAEN